MAGTGPTIMVPEPDQSHWMPPIRIVLLRRKNPRVIDKNGYEPHAEDTERPAALLSRLETEAEAPLCQLKSV